MAAQKGSMFLLKKGNGEAGVESFTAVAGMKTNSFSVKNPLVDSTNLTSGAWRQLSATSGKTSITISGSGIFYDSEEEETVRGWAFAGIVKNYQLSFGNGDNLTGPFLISSYQREGNNNEEETYSLTLESAGEINFTHI